MSRRHGWACENKYNYELVTATGEILSANAASNPDLWLALKGGSNNFGIVTRIDAKTYPLTDGKMWGGGISFNYTKDILAAQARTFSNFMKPENFDDGADMGMALVFQNPDAVYAAAFQLYYTEPVEGVPPVYQPFAKIKPQVASASGPANVTSLVLSANGVLPTNAQR